MRMRLYFVLFILLWELNASAWNIKVTKPIYTPGNEIKATLFWSPGEGNNATSITAQLILPGGTKLYITPSRLTASKSNYGIFDLSKSGSLELINFTYPLDKWLPPGVYRINVFTGGLKLPSISSQFEITSHYVPLTYQGKDPEFGPFFVVETENGYWIVMACKPYENKKGYPLWAMKISPDGHTLVPPFFTGSYKYSTNLFNKQGLNYFAVSPTSTGGFYVLSNTKDPKLGNELTLCKFDSDGRRLEKRVLKTSKNNAFSSIWFKVLPDKILVTAGNDGTLYLYIFSDEEKSIQLYPSFSGVSYRAFFDKDTKKLFVLIENYYNNEVVWEALDLEGHVLFEKKHSHL